MLVAWQHFKNSAGQVQRSAIRPTPADRTGGLCLRLPRPALLL